MFCPVISGSSVLRTVYTSTQRSKLFTSSYIPTLERKTKLNLTIISDIYIWQLHLAFITDIYIWQLHLAFISDSYLWRLYLTFLFDIYIWHFYLTFISDIYLWRSYLTFTFDIYIWHMYWIHFSRYVQFITWNMYWSKLIEDLWAKFSTHKVFGNEFQKTRTKLAASEGDWRLPSSPIVEKKMCNFLM